MISFPRLRQPAPISSVDAHLSEIVIFRKPFPAGFLDRPHLPEDAEITNDQVHSVSTWEDSTLLLSEPNMEVQSDESDVLETLERRDKAIAHDITNGILCIRRSHGSWEMNQAALFVDVWEDLKRASRSSDGAMNWLQIAAAVKARWWDWAKHPARERPLPPHGWSTRPPQSHITGTATIFDATPA
jgi:hypothetical protein